MRSTPALKPQGLPTRSKWHSWSWGVQRSAEPTLKQSKEKPLLTHLFTPPEQSPLRKVFECTRGSHPAGRQCGSVLRFPSPRLPQWKWESSGDFPPLRFGYSQLPHHDVRGPKSSFTLLLHTILLTCKLQPRLQTPLSFGLLWFGVFWSAKHTSLHAQLAGLSLKSDGCNTVTFRSISEKPPLSILVKTKIPTVSYRRYQKQKASYQQLKGDL